MEAKCGAQQSASCWARDSTCWGRDCSACGRGSATCWGRGCSACGRSSKCSSAARVPLRAAEVATGVAGAFHQRPNAKSDFADVKRHCNRTLQRMYSQWQAELAAARQEERVFVQTGQSNLLATNQLLDSEKREHEALKGRHEMLKQELQRLQNDYKKTKTDLQGQNSELQSKLDKQEAELKAKHESEMAKVNMEAASKLLAETSKLTAAQTELEQQTKLLKEATDEAARIKARSKAKSGEMRHDYVRFRAKVATAVVAWRHSRLDSANLRLELFKACALQKF